MLYWAYTGSSNRKVPIINESRTLNKAYDNLPSCHRETRPPVIEVQDIDSLNQNTTRYNLHYGTATRAVDVGAPLVAPQEASQPHRTRPRRAAPASQQAQQRQELSQVIAFLTRAQRKQRAPNEGPGHHEGMGLGEENNVAGPQWENDHLPSAQATHLTIVSSS